MSLSDLIGFYSNCSCILENESLAVPVVPTQGRCVCVCVCLLRGEGKRKRFASVCMHAVG